MKWFQQPQQVMVGQQAAVGQSFFDRCEYLAEKYAIAFALGWFGGIAFRHYSK